MKRWLLLALLLCCVTGFALAEETAEAAKGFNFNILAVICLLVAMAVCIFISAKRAKWNAAMIAKAAVCSSVEKIDFILQFKLG